MFFIDQIYKIPFPYTNESSKIPEARKRYSFRADPSRIGTIESAPREGVGGEGVLQQYNVQQYNVQQYNVENTLTQSLMFSSKAGCSKSISSITFAIE